MFELLLQSFDHILEGPFSFLMTCFHTLQLCFQSRNLCSLQPLLQLTDVLLVTHLSRTQDTHTQVHTQVHRSLSSLNQVRVPSYPDCVELLLHLLEAEFGLLLLLLQLRLQALSL